MPGDTRICQSCGFESRSGLRFCPNCGASFSSHSQSKVRNPYQILQIANDAELEVVSAAYKSLAKKYHPDQNKSSQAEAKMRDLNWAYDLLSDSSRRKAWDDLYGSGINRQQSQDEYVRPQSASRSKGGAYASTPKTYRDVPQKKDSNGITILAALFIVIFLAYVCVSSSRPTNGARSNSNSGSVFVSSTATRIPTSTPRPTEAIRPITFLGNRCLHWSAINKSYLGQKRCVYGRVYTFGPYRDRWDTIYFSASSSSFRVIDFNYYWLTPLEVGSCVVIYGTIRDYGPYLMITPDKDLDSPILVGDYDASCAG